MTVMFCDLVDSTRLSGELDPEDLREVLQAFRDTARSVVVRHGGFVASHMGDGVLVLFAYPRAHEDDPHRAVRAALELVRNVEQLTSPLGVRLRVRVGIATGLVVIGQLLGSERSFDEVVVGQTVNLAARLQALAAPDRVVVSETTKRLIDKAFDCSFLGAERLKGFEQPVPVWQASRELADHELEPRPGPSSEPPPLVGRRDELQLLTERWRAARGGHGSVVIIQGEPGVGKSRLALALRQVAAADSANVARLVCAPRFQNSALYPVIRHIERALGILPDDGFEQKLQKIEAQLGPESQGSTGATTVLARLLSAPGPKPHEPDVDSAEKLKQRTFAWLKAWLFATAERAPLLLIFEDMHWADPTTLELVNEVLEGIAGRAMLVVATARPGFGVPLQLAPDSLQIGLSRLTSEEAQQIVLQVAEGRLIPGAVMEHILRQSEGVPLFIEEITKAALESGALRARWDTDSWAQSTRIPSTLQDSLEARLDRLSPIKVVAQVAAAIGRDFSYGLLASVLEVPKDELDSALRALAETDLIHPQAGMPEIYSFKHALLQDAAYGMMLKSTRQRLHRRIALALENGAGGQGVEPDVIAHHWIEAAQPALAIPHLEQAALAAFARAAHTEAGRHYSKALELVASELSGPVREASEFRLSVGLGLAASAVRGYAAPEVQQAYQRALDVSRKLEDNVELFPALRGLCTFYIVRAGLATALELSQECLRLAQLSGNVADLIESWTALGYSSVYLGALSEGLDYLARAIDLYRAESGDELTYPSLQDPAVACLSLAAIVAYARGEAAVADRLCSEGLALADRLGHPFNRAYASSFAALLDNLRFRHADAKRHADLALQIANEHGFAVWSGAATLQGQIASGMLGNRDAIPVLEHVLGLWQAGGAELSLPYFAWGLARCQRHAGDRAGALRSVERALEVAARTGEAFIASEFYRLRAELRHEMNGDAERSWRDDFATAIALARSQGAALLECRALRAYCRRVAEPEAAERERLAALSAALDGDNDEDHHGAVASAAARP